MITLIKSLYILPLIHVCKNMSVKVTTKHLYMGFGQVNGLSGLFYQTLSKTKCV